MRNVVSSFASLAAFVLITLATPAHAQVDSRLVVDPWPKGAWGVTNDHLLYQGQGDVGGERNKDAQVFWWQSDGRFRSGTTDPDAPVLGYHWTTINFDTNSARIPDHLDDVGLAVGFHLGRIADGDVSAVLGLGYTGDSPFDNESGIYGTGHVTWRHTLNATDSLVLSIDYQGDSAFLPDVPLPGFQFVRRTDTLSFGVGYPRSWLHWGITDRLALDANYAVPYTGDVTLSYQFTKEFSLFGQYANSFDAFVLSGQDATDRIFYQMSRAEVGVRYVNPTLFGKVYVDASLSIGYAFEQNFSTGYDVRDIRHFSSISDQPYIGLMVAGRF